MILQRVEELGHLRIEVTHRLTEIFLQEQAVFTVAAMLQEQMQEVEAILEEMDRNLKTQDASPRHQGSGNSLQV